MKIPAIRGKIGETIYYSTNLTFQQIADLVKKVDTELHTSTSLKDEIQRSLSNNYIKIKEYILNIPDHFFNALVLAVYDGEPQWTEIRYEIGDERFYDVGVLQFNGKEKIFPVDGQHRVEGIKAALAQNKDLAKETVSVMLIGHSATPTGMAKSRRIFSTLNRYAKPVKLGDIIALDEDDVIAIATRELLENYPLFCGDRIKATNTKSIPINDKSSFTSLITLYECNGELFQIYHFNKNISSTKLKEFQKSRPDDNIISGYNEYLINFWDKFTRNFPEVSDYLALDPTNAALKYRNFNDGGNILFRPVSLLQLIKAIAYIKSHKSNDSIDTIMQKFSLINRNVSDAPWTRIIWDPISKRMMVTNSILLKLLFVYMYDPRILDDRDYKQLLEKYALVHNIDNETAKNAIKNFII